MKEENILIAEFMGLKKGPIERCIIADGTSKEEDVQSYYESASRIVLPHQLKYSYSWDWLMPVVEKIAGLYHAAFPGNEEFIRRVLAHEEPIDGPYMDVIAIPMNTSIDEVYKAIVSFIKWYNSQTEQR